jgi:hypothetical protein
VPDADDSGFPDRVLPDPGAEGRPEPDPLRPASTSLANQQETVAKAVALGACHIDVGQRPEEGHVVLADCGFIGALSCDGTQEGGYFWSEALGWPLVWDQHQETAIRSPHGGPKVTWGGPPVAPKTGKNRLHFRPGSTRRR